MTQNIVWYKYLAQRKMLVVLLLGFASGLPLGLSTSVLQAWFAVDGVSIVTIGFLGLVGQPYVYKFLWAPFLDKWCLPYLGLRKGWMFSMQLLLIVILIAMATCNPKLNPYQLGLLALLLAFCSASQDIAIDAYRTEILHENEKGMGAALAVTGYRIAMLVSGSFALIMAHYLGFQITYLAMALVMGVGIFATLLGKEPCHLYKPRVSLLKAFSEPLKEFLSRKNALALLAFIILYKMGDAFAGSLTTAFLIRGVGFSLLDIGLINKTVGLVATLLGVFVGGAWMIKWGLYRALFWFGVVQAITNLLFWLLALIGHNYSLMVMTIFLENFGGGLGTAAFLALLMTLCDSRFTATQFALLSALSAVGRVFVGPMAGMLVDICGWPEFFVWTTLLALPGLLILVLIKSTIVGYQEKQHAVHHEALEEASVAS